ncbi:response regulator [Gelidibacter gilvus]|uniref:Response regulator n=1 Tax=Gelidibacter gilvus TaxID=59602 RepID=A0A4Q0XF81_9FLAO|nr:response regulator [Gelidibacter gilvus]RXJ45734.1 response regulator [Gelidibacter gilvus]
MTQTARRFILVDDDPLNNFLTKMILKKTFGEVLVNDFTVPEDGLEFLKFETEKNATNRKTTLFLDINMPTLSGWEFLEAFERLDASIKEQYTIYILSSSVNLNDIDFAQTNPLVSDFIEKPLNKAKLIKILG